MLRLWTRYFGAGGWEATNLFFSSYEEGRAYAANLYTCTPIKWELRPDDGRALQ